MSCKVSNVKTEGYYLRVTFVKKTTKSIHVHCHIAILSSVVEANMVYLWKCYKRTHLVLPMTLG